MGNSSYSCKSHPSSSCSSNSSKSKSYSSNSSKSKDNNHEWTDSKGCNCEEKKYCSSKKILKKSYRLPGDGALTAGRCIAGICTGGLTEAGYAVYKKATNAGDGLNHYFIEIDYYCDNCKYHNEFKKTYEWEWNAEMKCQEIKGYFGYYKEYDTIKDSIDKQLKYETIEKKFDEFKKSTYDHCQIFANKFFDALKKSSD
jgi:hypothetical protein